VRILRFFFVGEPQFLSFLSGKLVILWKDGGGGGWVAVGGVVLYTKRIFFWYTTKPTDRLFNLKLDTSPRFSPEEWTDTMRLNRFSALFVKKTQFF
jgi:hypothetical protein